MPRSARLDAPGVLHHIIIRGIERKTIFRDDEDREDFLSRLGRLLPSTKTSCFAWALIPNHAHLLLRTGSVPLSTLMSRLLTGYAGYFNRRHKRSGQLFQNRYKSILCQEEIYFSELVRYIHLNPLRAGLVNNLAQLNRYAFCGHGVLMGHRRRDWQDADYVLRYFGKQASDARRQYCSFVESGIDQGRRDELTGGGLIRSLGGWSAVQKRNMRDARIKSDERILGDGDFVDTLLSEANERFERHYEMRRHGIDMEKIAERAATLCSVEPADIFSRGKQPGKVKARSLFCYWVVSELGISHLELARRIGISGPGVGTCVERGKHIAAENGYRLLAGMES